MTYRDVLRAAVSDLNAAGHEESEIDARYLIEAVSGFDGTAWFVHMADEMPESQKTVFDGYVDRLLRDEPVSYIINSRGFMGLDFYVDENVLIPRQDTELLVEEALKQCAEAISDEEYKILDLCTGSGCIAISIKKFLKNKPVKVTASDISEKALCVAKKNAADNGAEIDFIKSDMLEGVGDGYDMIVSNPPYIPKVQMDGLDKKVVEHEPYGALYGGEDGLDFYRVIASETAEHIKYGGRLLLEIGFDQGESVPKLLEAEGFDKIKVLKDYNGLDRVVCAVFGKLS